MISNHPFQIARSPQLYSGSGRINELAPIIRQFGSRVLLVTGARSFTGSRFFATLQEQLTLHRITLALYPVNGEPSPSTIDQAVREFQNYRPDVVVAIGGGSALDAGKAISAMLPIEEPVKIFLEGVGTSVHPGTKVPFIAVPTTAGTGSEATKNAVISQVGNEGFKKSLRHDNFVPDVVILDPELIVACPKHVTASCGMDAFTQLLESYLSTAANPFTDALALKGLDLVSTSLLRSYVDGEDIDARSSMALAAYFSGVTLANAGLGVVHGLAGTIGGIFPLAHGEICSALMFSANRDTVKKLRARQQVDALKKYAEVGRVFHRTTDKPDAFYVDHLLDEINKMMYALDIRNLSKLGLHRESFDSIAAASDAKNNPVNLTKEEMVGILDEAF